MSKPQRQNYIPPIPVIQLRPGCLLFYDQSFYSYSGQRNPHLKINEDAFDHKLYTGKMNDKSKSRLRFAINLLVAQAKWKEVQNPTTKKFYRFKINFITLTLSARQKDLSDKLIKSKMLFPWIRNMRNVYHLRSYVWRAERQKNGNIHFHFSTDTYIPYDAIRDAWNYQQSKFHFITDFRNRNKSEFPNSTDVHAVYNIRNLASYLVKYMVKDEKGLDSIEGKVWDCSKNLKLKDRVVFEMTEQDFSMLNRISNDSNFKVISNDNCALIPMSNAQMSKVVPGEYWRKYNQWLQSVYDSAAPPRLKIVK